MRGIALGGAVLICLVVIHAVFPSISGLPLAGSEIAQLGVVLGTAFAVTEFIRISRGRNEH